jgi:hypothetical protein
MSSLKMRRAREGEQEKQGEQKEQAEHEKFEVS